MASFPTSTKTWANKVDSVDTVSASHINDAYAEIIALENFLASGTKIPSNASTNYTEFEADGTIKMNGSATVFNDMQFNISGGRVGGANFPTWETFTTNTKEYSFAVNDYIDLCANEMPHSWKLGSDGRVHLHVALKAANATGANRYAKFTAYVAYSDESHPWVEASPMTAELTIPTGTAALTSYRVTLGTLTLTGYGLSTEIKVMIKRIAATGGTEYSGNIFLSQVGVHLEEDTIGSRQVGTK